MTSEYIRYSELTDQLVLNRSTLDELGKIEVLWEYPQAHRVLGFICKSGPFDRHKTAFNLDQLDTIGSNGVLVTSEPVETDAERVRQIQSLVNSEVWTDTGNRIGKIIDHVFHLKTGIVRQYLISTGGLPGFVSKGLVGKGLASKGLGGTVYALYPSQILSLGSRRVLVSAAIVDQLEVYQGGIQDRISKLSDVLRDEKAQASQGLQSLMSRARTKAQILAEQAKEQAQILSTELLESAEQAKDRIRDLSEDLREDFLESDYRPRESNQDDFDFDDWEEAPLPRRRSQPSQSSNWDDEPAPPRPKLNLEPKQNPPTPNRQNPPQNPDRDFDPWDDEWN